MDLRDPANDRDARTLQSLVDLSLAMGRNRDVEKVLEAAADAVLQLLDADRAFVILSSRDVVARAYAPGQSGEPSLSVAELTLTDGEEVLTGDIREFENISESRSVVDMRIRTVLCVPLFSGPRVMGALYADSVRRNSDQLKNIAWAARAFAAHASQALEGARVLGVAQRRSRRAREAAHDIRNLVGALQMGLDELQELALPEWATQTLIDLKRINSITMTTATSALSVARPQRTALNLAELVSTTVRLHRYEAKKKSVQFTTDLTDVEVLGTADALARVVSNLVGNALKYSPTGGTIVVRVAPDGDDAWLSVADDGTGIPASQLVDIFESETQADGALEGFGLGLGICKSIVGEHGGTIEARNNTQGAEFIVRLRRRPTPGPFR